MTTHFCLLYKLQSLSGHTSSVQSVTFDSAEVLVLAGSSNGTIKLWDLEEAKREFYLHIPVFTLDKNI